MGGVNAVAKPLRWVPLALAVAAATGCGKDKTGITGPGTNQHVPNFVQLQSDPGDYIGGGQTYKYTQASAVITQAVSGGHLSIGITGDQSWSGDFQVPSSLSRLQPGDYTDLQRYPFHDPAKGGLSWYGEGRGCNTLSGWFTVDSVSYDGDNLSAVDLRFEQHCEGGATALHGAIHWRADDTTRPPGPVNPIPADLWAPAPGATPSSGDYIYLASDPGDYVGASATYTYTAANATITAGAENGYLSISVNGVQWWFGDFQIMNTLTRFQRGYYPNLRRYPFHNPTRGGLDWAGEGRGCNTLLGWFVVDAVTYTDATLTAIDLRFEQHCEGATPALHGALHWHS